MRYPYHLMIFMMMMLEVLQIFWTYFITESFISVKVSKKVVHSYDWLFFIIYQIIKPKFSHKNVIIKHNTFRQKIIVFIIYPIGFALKVTF